MCGIAGEINYKLDPIGDSWAKRSCRIMTHRGPDGHGYFVEDGVSFGHRRLSIIDLAGGDQPMTYLNRYTITYNGEIYNYKQLKQDLIQAGLPFATQSDTEVILAAYAFWGIDCLKRLNGIFSFAIWDTQEHTLLLARDHLGIKPLLYHVDDIGICFASELKALLAHPRVTAEIDPNSLQDYLSMGYVLSPRTIIKDVKKLPAGHYLFVSGRDVTMAQYWDLAQAVNSAPSSKSEDELIEQFTSLLRDKVQEQMVSDVPVGSFLSGGIDSSSISLFANQISPHAIKTFSAGFSEDSYSELDYAEQVANHIQSDHYQDIIPPVSIHELSDLVWKYDEPLGDTSLIATHFVAKIARDHVTVVLSGDGGDELLAGYDTYLADKLQAIYAKIPSVVHHRIIQPAVNLIPSTYKKVSWDFKVKQFISQAYTSAEQAHFGWRLMFNDSEVAVLMGGNQDDYHPFLTYSEHYNAVKSANPLNQSLYVDVKTWLVDDILTKVDRATMACSLEARVPFLAWDMVEFAMRLPSRLKLHGTQRKYILKKAMESQLPDHIIHRKKRGFNTPIGIWMQKNLQGTVDELLLQSSSNIVDVQHTSILRLWNEHKSGQVDHSFRLWTLLSLLLWEQSVYMQEK